MNQLDVAIVSLVKLIKINELSCLIKQQVHWFSVGLTLT